MFPCSHVPMFPEIFPKLPRIRGVGVVPCNHATIAGMAGMAGIGRNGRFSGENGPLKTRIFAIFEIRKSAENPENSKIGGKKCSHVPMFPEIFQKTSPTSRMADRPRPMSPPAGRGSEHIGFGISGFRRFLLLSCGFRRPPIGDWLAWYPL